MKRILNILVLMSVTFMFVGCSSAANTSDSAVKDSTAPTITFSKKEVNLKAGESFNVPANIKVVDDTDGNLKEVKKIEEGKAGYVVDDEKVDLTKAGTYTVSVTAVDSSGNKAKSSFSVKVTEDKEEAETETESKETENTESKSESSSSNSSATNSSSASNSSASKNTGSSSGNSTSSSNSGSSSSTSKPSAGGSSSPGNKPSSGTSNSGSASKPSTGNSGSGSSKPSTGGSSSGSGSATKPSGSSGSTGGSSGGSTPAPKHDCKDVVVKEAWTETVVDKEAWVETVVDKEAWAEAIWVVDVPAYDEPIYEAKIICNRCDKILNTKEEVQQHTMGDPNSTCFLSGYSTASVQTGTRHIPEVGHSETINHPAETHTVNHPAETHTVNHPAETKEVCS